MAARARAGFGSDWLANSFIEKELNSLEFQEEAFSASSQPPSRRRPMNANIQVATAVRRRPDVRGLRVESRLDIKTNRLLSFPGQSLRVVAHDDPISLPGRGDSAHWPARGPATVWRRSKASTGLHCATR